MWIGIAIVCFLFHLPNYLTVVAAKWDRLFQDDFRHFFTGALILKSGFPILYSEQGFLEFAGRKGLAPVLPYARSTPALFMLLTPLTELRLMDASRLWLIANHLMVWASLFLMLRNWKAALPWAVLALAFAPFLDNLVQGQINGMVLLSTALTFWLVCEGFPIMAGLALSVAIVAKLFPALIAFYFLLRGPRRTGLAALGAALGLNLLAGLLYGWDNLLAYPGSLRAFQLKNFEDQSIHHALGTVPYVLIGLAVVVGLGWLFAKRPKSFAAEFCLLLVTQYVISSYSTAAQQLGLLLVFAWVANRAGTWPLALCYAAVSMFDGYVTRNPAYAKVLFHAMQWHIPAYAVLATWLLLFRRIIQGDEPPDAN